MSTVEQAGGKTREVTAPFASGLTRSDVALLAGVTGLASVLPLLVTTRWYDYYYWPKVQALYAVLLVLTPIGLWTDRGRWLPALRSPAAIALLSWLAVVAAATLTSVNPLLSFAGEDYRYEGLLTWLAYGAVMACAAGTLTTAGRIRLFLAAALATAGAMAVLGLLQHAGWTPVPEDALRTGWTRAWGTTGSPLALGAYLALLLPVLVSLYAGTAVTVRRCALGALAVLLYAALVATSSRAAWGGAVVGGAVWALASGRERLRGAARPLLFLGIACAAATLVVVRTTAPESSGHAANPRAAEQRLVLWTTVAPLVVRRPLLGWGPETLADVYPAYGSPEFLRAFPQAAIERIYVDRPHNDLLQQAVATGLIGLAVYVWMWTALFHAAWKMARTGGAAVPVSGLASGLLGGFTAYFIQLQASFSFVSVAPVFWCLVGLLVALERSVHRPEKLTASLP